MLVSAPVALDGRVQWTQAATVELPSLDHGAVEAAQAAWAALLIIPVRHSGAERRLPPGATSFGDGHTRVDEPAPTGAHSRGRRGRTRVACSHGHPWAGPEQSSRTRGT